MGTRAALFEELVTCPLEFRHKVVHNGYWRDKKAERDESVALSWFSLLDRSDLEHYAIMLLISRIVLFDEIP